ncbi:hypothetical protein SAMN05421753_11523 [Planctomicrobium piriforme]|uniref:Uncharacterized protein n=2 Tax=Planctomicrobium piriforme TaxID=1576369 RepID=A0A1I3N880_9PLAN|nr:hypothetical protein SAMN05421753_11523 [Planctomicrobium piriforme]
MRDFEFTVILSGLPEMTVEASNQLYEAGCDDGSPGSSCGVSHIDFHRSANSLEEAIRSAIGDVLKAGFAVDRVELRELASLSPAH